MVSEEELSAFSDAFLASAPLAGASAPPLQRFLAGAADAHSFQVRPADFGRFVACRVESGRPLLDALGALHLADLYLVCGCLEDVRGAADAFLARFAPDIARVAARFARSRSVSAEDLVQAVLTRMLVGEAERPPRLALYRGTGALGGFVEVTAARIAIDATRTERERLEPEAGAFARLLVAPGTPESLLGDQHARAHLRSAFERAAAGLEPRARAVLAFSLCDGLSIDAIGRTYGVHRATAARWIDAAREALVRATRAELAQSLRLGETQLDVLLREGLSRFELSVTRCLKDGRAP